MKNKTFRNYDASSLSTIKNYWKKCILKDNSCLDDVVENLNNTGLKISLIVDLKGKFIGTITDGDIRRSLNRKQLAVNTMEAELFCYIVSASSLSKKVQC